LQVKKILKDTMIETPHSKKQKQADTVYKWATVSGKTS
jgi:hypothetical protein